MSGSLKTNFLLIKGLILFFTVFSQVTVNGKEGMWIPSTLKAHEKDLKAWGLEIPVEKLYNENGTGFNNAIVLFGRGCTGELISSKGLILTNHHCGYGSVQGLSSPGNDYFANGFWAMSNKEELPVRGLTVTFIRRMENVTARILGGISDTLRDEVRDTIVSNRITAVEKEFKGATHLDATIKPYFKGNQYWVAITETYRDIRLVGFPPNGIGAFGGDVENWMWPRHTGDFSIFRVYAGADNKPADYAVSNKPYQTEQFFNINISGYKEGAFTMVYGFPGTTDEYISSYELKQVYSITDPISIGARTRRLDVWSRHMAASRDIFLKYTSKRAGVANGWKKWQGEVQGLKINNVTGKKQASEKAFQKWAATSRQYPYAKDLLPEMRKTAEHVDSLIYQDQYAKECPLAIELIQQGAVLERVAPCYNMHLTDSALRDTLEKIAVSLAGFYKNYDAATDKEVFIDLMRLYFEKCSSSLPDYFRQQYHAHHDDIRAWADDIFSNSKLLSPATFITYIADAGSYDSMKVLEDPAWQLYHAITAFRKEKIAPVLKNYYSKMRYLDRLYMAAQMAKDEKKSFYPDANLTLRLAYGKVQGLKPDGPARYMWQTHLSEVVALDDTASDIFKVPPKLKQLYRSKDFGRWAEKGDVPVAFVASNHTSGGNSGSPVLNNKGELTGTNFDRAYEGTMSDYYFDPKRCRNISVDIRYTLFIIEKFGGAGWLLDEMKLVGGKPQEAASKTRRVSSR
jgi:hypothetical protein